jgi:hypothetical protein
MKKDYHYRAGLATTTVVEDAAASSFANVEDTDPELVTELPLNASWNGRGESTTARAIEELRALIDSQANKIRDLQERVKKRDGSVK